MNIHLRKLGAVLIVAVLTAAGCGGSSGGGDSSPPPTDPPPTDPPPSGGIVRSGVAVGAGPITGFGSVIVNGATYDTSATLWIRDGDDSFSQDDFKVGETVIVKGSIDDNDNTVAETVELDELVKGPATQAAGSTATVMGQPVRSDAGTIIDDDCNTPTTDVSFDDLSDLTAFFAVEVYGNVQPDDGSIKATFIECKTEADLAGDEFEVNGLAEMVTATTIMVNGLQVDYSMANLGNDFPGGQISENDPVEVKGTEFSAGVAPNPDTLVATRVEYKGNRLVGAEGDHYEIEGFISVFRGVDDFDVRVGLDTFTVITDPDTTTFEGDPNLLDVNVKVEVDGEIDGDNNLFATKVEIKTSTNIRVTGVVDTIVNGEIRILNILINTDGTTQFDDKRDDNPDFDASLIVEEDYIEVRGQEAPPGQITAFEVRRDDLDTDLDNTELRGFTEPDSVVTDSSATGYRESFRVLGVTIDMTGPGIAYRDPNELPITADEFWAVIEIEAAGGNGYLVDIKGAEQDDGTTLRATEVELEME
jgi:hypothetical protein